MPYFFFLQRITVWNANVNVNVNVLNESDRKDEKSKKVIVFYSVVHHMCQLHFHSSFFCRSLSVLMRFQIFVTHVFRWGTWYKYSQETRNQYCCICVPCAGRCRRRCNMNSYTIIWSVPRELVQKLFTICSFASHYIQRIVLWAFGIKRRQKIYIERILTAWKW